MTEYLSRQGQYFDGPGRTKVTYPPFETIQDELPEPLMTNRTDLLDLYYYSWKIAYANVQRPHPNSGFVSDFIDAAFNEDIFLWDTVFITMFADYARETVPGIEALDNFYVKQQPNGEIPREIIRETGEDVPFWVNHDQLPLHSYFHNHYGFRGLWTTAPPQNEEKYYPDLGRHQSQTAYYTLDNLNHPILAWAEWKSYLLVGDKIRLTHVYRSLIHYYQAIKALLQHRNGLYVTDWASMDNSPRNHKLTCGVDISCEMVLFANNMVQIIEEIHSEVDNADQLIAMFKEDAHELKVKINELMWDEETKFYYDLDLKGEQIKIKTAAAFWSMISYVASDDKVLYLREWLEDKSTFNRIHRVPVVAADEEGYDSSGGYWRGSVWAPTNTMIIDGLEARGHSDLAKDIAHNHLENVLAVYKDTGTVWENYPADSVTSGDADKYDFIGWSGIGPINYLYKYYIGLQASGKLKTVTWTLDETILDKNWFGCKNFNFSDIRADFRARKIDGKIELVVETNQSFKLVIRWGSVIEEHQVTQEFTTLLS